MATGVVIRPPYQPPPGAPQRGTIRVAGLQMSGVEGDVAANFARVEAQLREAARQGAQIALTPEAALSGYTDGERSRAAALAVPGPETERLARLCAELRIYLLAGLVARAGEGYTNSVAVLGPEGLLGTFSKVHINRYEEGIGYTRGDRFPTWDLCLGGTPVRIGVMICYDREVPEAARLLMLQGIDILFNPLACTCPADEIHRALIRVRAFENEICLVMVNHAAPRMNGLSFVVGPHGGILCEAGAGQEVFVCDLDVGALDTHREQGIYGFRHRRPELYAALADPSGVLPSGGRSAATRK
jgi:5-aminopentanamidase